MSLIFQLIMSCIIITLLIMDKISVAESLTINVLVLIAVILTDIKNKISHQPTDL